jgi:hypothetical protein
MNFNLIIARYRTPKSLTRLSVPELEELFNVLDTMENPFIKTKNAFDGNPIPDNIRPLTLILRNVIKEINSRDSLQGTELAGTDLPRLEKVYFAGKAKTDVMRIIDALYELQYFRDSQGFAMSREKIFSSFGELFDGGLPDYAQALSQAYSSTSEEANTAVFDKMKRKIVEKMAQTLERANNK